MSELLTQSQSSNSIPSTSKMTSTRIALTELMAQRDALELEADIISCQLKSIGPDGEAPIGITESLVDKDGFPRGDVNIYDARTKRQRLNVINTDHKELMAKIETLMQQIHQESKLDLFGDSEFQKRETEKLSEQYSNATKGVTSLVINGSLGSGTGSDNGRIPENIHQYQIIAIIDEILVGSPSHAAGLLNNDYLIYFGGVCHVNPRTVEQINYAELMYCTSNISSVCLSRIPSVVKGFHMNGHFVLKGKSENENSSESSDSPKLDHIPIIICREVNRILSYKYFELKPAVWGGRGLLGCHLTPMK